MNPFLRCALANLDGALYWLLLGEHELAAADLAGARFFLGLAG